MSDNINKDAASRMGKSIEALKEALSKVRTGRAHSSLLDHVLVPYYGSDVPLSQVASVSAADFRTLMVTPWEKDMVPAIEKAILNSDLGLNPASSGGLVRVPLPALTEERRKELIKVVRAEAETARVAIRNIRRDANGDLKALVKNKEISADEEHRAQEDIQKLTDKYVADVDKLLVEKEADLMEI